MNKSSKKTEKVVKTISLILIASIVAFLIGTEIGPGLYYIIN